METTKTMQAAVPAGEGGFCEDCKSSAQAGGGKCEGCAAVPAVAVEAALGSIPKWTDADRARLSEAMKDVFPADAVPAEQRGETYLTDEEIDKMASFCFTRADQITRHAWRMLAHKVEAHVHRVAAPAPPIGEAGGVVVTKAPFSNCQFRECDLPGQCRAEGKCHHPRAAAPQAGATLSGEPVADSAYPTDCWTKEQLEGWAAKLLFSGDKLGEPLMTFFNAWNAEVRKLTTAQPAQTE